MDVASVLKTALAAVEEAGISEDLRPIAFEHAIRLSIAAGAPTVPDEGLQLQAAQASNGAAMEPSGLDRLSTYLNVQRPVVASVYQERDGILKVMVTASRLEKAKSDKVRQLVLLIVGGRMIGEYDEDWVSWDIVRSTCEPYGVDDSNIAANVRKVRNLMIDSPGKGKGNIKGVKLDMNGLEDFAALFKSLTTSNGG